MGEFVTPEAARERFRELAAQVDAAYDEMRALSSDGVGNEFRAELAERLETQQRTNRGLMYRGFAEMADPPDEAGMAPVLVNSLAARLRIPPREVKRRMKVAARIRPRRQLCGPVLEPELQRVAQAVEAGAIGVDHLRVISRAIDGLPSCVSMTDRSDVERSLVAEASKNDAEIVKAVAARIDEIFNPDGDYDEADRARRRGLQLGQQGPDGMSRLSGWIDPETRSYVEAVTAAVRPGRHLPDGTLAEVPDDRSGAQRRHDGIKLGLKAGIASGDMGSHRGHPVTVIVRTTLAELDQAAHAVTNPDIPMPAPARTGGDTALPMRDVIRMAADSIHYLVVFDDHSERPIYLARQQRIATTDQRIICYARDRGCTRPGCTVAGANCQVHHAVSDWADDGQTNVDDLTLACPTDNRSVKPGGWRTRKRKDGRTEWIPPPHLDSGQSRVNDYHHPENYLLPEEDSEADDG